MKRRSFVGLSFTGLISAPAAAEGGRIFGTPDSVAGPTDGLSDSLVLSIERMNLGLSSRAESIMAKSAQVWTDILTVDSERQAFERGPKKYLKAKGIPASIVKDAKSDITLLRVASSSQAREALQRGDFRAFLQVLADHGLGSDFTSGIGEAVRNIVLQDQERFRMIVQAEVRKLDPSLKSTELTDEMVARLMSPSADGGGNTTLCSVLAVACAAALAVVIALVVALYVSVGTAVTAGILAAVAISVLFEVAVTISTRGGEEPPEEEEKRVKDGDGNLMAASSLRHYTSRMRAYGDTYDTFRRASRAATLTGRPDASVELVKDFIKEEIRAVVGMCEELKLIVIDPQYKDVVIEDAAKRCYSMSGIVAA